MKFYKSSKALAIVVMIIFIVGSTISSGIHKINVLAHDPVVEFVQGEKGDGLSITRDLETRVLKAKNMIQIAKNYIGESDQDIKDVLAYIDILSTSEDKSDLYAANQNLQGSIDSLYARLQEMDVSDKNLNTLRQEKSIFDNAMQTISYDPYNQYVDTFYEKTDTMMGRLLRPFAKEVEYFR